MADSASIVDDAVVGPCFALGQYRLPLASVGFVYSTAVVVAVVTVVEAVAGCSAGQVVSRTVDLLWG